MTTGGVLLKFQSFLSDRIQKEVTGYRIKYLASKLQNFPWGRAVCFFKLYQSIQTLAVSYRYTVSCARKVNGTTYRNSRKLSRTNTEEQEKPPTESLPSASLKNVVSNNVKDNDNDFSGAEHIHLCQSFIKAPINIFCL